MNKLVSPFRTAYKYSARQLFPEASVDSPATETLYVTWFCVHGSALIISTQKTFPMRQIDLLPHFVLGKVVN